MVRFICHDLGTRAKNQIMISFRFWTAPTRSLRERLVQLFVDRHRGTIGFADLSAFTFTAFGVSYNLGYVNSVPTDPSAGNYAYFDRTRCGAPIRSSGQSMANVRAYSAILAAMDGYNGFFVSLWPDRLTPARHEGADGQIFQYTTLVPGGDTTFASGNAEKLIQVTSYSRSRGPGHCRSLGLSPWRA